MADPISMKDSDSRLKMSYSKRFCFAQQHSVITFNGFCFYFPALQQQPIRPRILIHRTGYLLTKYTLKLLGRFGHIGD